MVESIAHFERRSHDWRGSGSKGVAEEPLSRLLKLKTLKNLPQPPKDTVRTLKIQRGACYSRVSGYMSAHLARVKSAPVSTGTLWDVFGKK